MSTLEILGVCLIIALVLCAGPILSLLIDHLILNDFRKEIINSVRPPPDRPSLAPVWPPLPPPPRIPKFTRFTEPDEEPITERIRECPKTIKTPN